MLIKAHFQDNASEIEYDPDEGFETLRFQLVSLFDLDETSLIVVDFLGREVRLGFTVNKYQKSYIPIIFFR
jgi:hypothetical protein